MKDIPLLSCFVDAMKFSNGKMLDKKQTTKTRMWANAQRDGCPAKYKWRPMFNATKFG